MEGSTWDGWQVQMCARADGHERATVLGRAVERASADVHCLVEHSSSPRMGTDAQQLFICAFLPPKPWQA